MNLHLVPDTPEPQRQPMAGGRISGDKSRHAERRKLVAAMDSAVEWCRRSPWSMQAKAALYRAQDRLRAFDAKNGGPDGEAA